MSFVEQQAEPTPMRRLLTVTAVVASAVVTVAAVVGSTVAARWRGIILTHILVVTIWLAIQVFVFASNAFGYLYTTASVWIEKISRLPESPIRESLNRGRSPRLVSSAPMSSAPTTNCWRDRSLEGDCFRRAEYYRTLPPARWYISEPPMPPCPRYYVC